jgi:ABC-type multidrug transport system ATPase subunit
VHRFISELVARGLSVILVSSELPEVLGLADRIVVMHQGRVAQSSNAADATPENGGGGSIRHRPGAGGMRHEILLKQRETATGPHDRGADLAGRPARAGFPERRKPGQPAHRQHPAHHAGAGADAGDRHARHRPVGGFQPGAVRHGAAMLASHFPACRCRW